MHGKVVRLTSEDDGEGFSPKRYHFEKEHVPLLASELAALGDVTVVGELTTDGVRTFIVERLWRWEYAVTSRVTPMGAQVYKLASREPVLVGWSSEDTDGSDDLSDTRDAEVSGGDDH